MMPQAATENVICIACGADIRSDAVFCYNCGANIVAGDDDGEAARPEMPVQILDAEPGGSDAVLEGPESPEGGSSNLPDKARRPLTAAMLRRKKAHNRRPIEIEWQEQESEPMFFLYASIVIFVFAVLILAAALYLK